jgi:hypothetical protein
MRWTFLSKMRGNKDSRSSCSCRSQLRSTAETIVYLYTNQIRIGIIFPDPPHHLQSCASVNVLSFAVILWPLCVATKRVYMSPATWAMLAASAWVSGAINGPGMAAVLSNMFILRQTASPASTVMRGAIRGSHIFHSFSDIFHRRCSCRAALLHIVAAQLGISLCAIHVLIFVVTR